MDFTDNDGMPPGWNIANDADWLTNAMALHDLVVPASEDAGTARAGELGHGAVHAGSDGASTTGLCCNHVCQRKNTRFLAQATGERVGSSALTTSPDAAIIGLPLIAGLSANSAADTLNGHTITETSSTINTGIHVNNSSNIIVCHDAESTPSGRQRDKRLKCGITGCTSTRLFDRKYELVRHMKTHKQGAYSCPVDECPRSVRAFTRSDKLWEHMRKAHGLEH